MHYVGEHISLQFFREMKVTSHFVRLILLYLETLMHFSFGSLSLSLQRKCTSSYSVCNLVSDIASNVSQLQKPIKGLINYEGMNKKALNQ